MTTKKFDKVQENRKICRNCYRPTREAVQLPRRAPGDEILTPTRYAERDDGTVFCECGVEDGGHEPRIYERPLTKERAVEVARNLCVSLRFLEYELDEDDEEKLVEHVRKMESDPDLSGKEDGVIFPRAVEEVVNE
jgi:hypothetical protein